MKLFLLDSLSLLAILPLLLMSVLRNIKDLSFKSLTYLDLLLFALALINSSFFCSL